MQPLASRTTAVVLFLVVAGLALAGCSSARAGSGCGVLPPDLPDSPEPCTTYCREWVPPVYRDVPRLVCVRPGYMACEPETQCRTRFQEICVKPAEVKRCKTPDWRCEQAVVQVKPGGYKWKRVPGSGCDGQDCWKYCYEEPCYQWCNKVVTQEGIEYCTEVPPEYRTVAYTEQVESVRQEYVPAEYCVQNVKELYRPGYWTWKACTNCDDCDCPGPCPTMPYKCQPCRPGTCVVPGVPRSN